MAEKAAATKKTTATKAPAKKAAAKKSPAAKTAEKAPAEKAPAEKAPAEKAPAKKRSAESPEDAMKRKFREALAHKHGNRGAESQGHDSGHGPNLASNDKRQQMFRRKSGG